LTCDDQNPCTDDHCEAGSGACTYATNVAICDDGNDCTVADVCTLGVCLGGQLEPVCCGDADGSGEINATDSMFILNVVVGVFDACPPAACDVDSSGRVTVTDSLAVLIRSTDGATEIVCPAPAASTTTVPEVPVSTTTPTQPAGE
jgi:hypothetical protein